MSNGSFHAFVRSGGLMKDLNTLVTLKSGSSPGFTELSGASGINNSGQIVGVGEWSDGKGASYSRASLLSPQTASVVATPTISPNGGSFSDSVEVTLACKTPGATIRYTTNGAMPSESSPAYTGPFTLSSSATVVAKAFKAGSTASLAYTAIFTISSSSGGVATPVISPNGGTHQGQLKVQISCATKKATIRYTTDGSTPTSTSPEYKEPLTLTASATVKAKAFKKKLTDSATASARFTITPYSKTVATPAISPKGGSFSSSVKVTLSCATSVAAFYYTTNGGEPTTASSKYKKAFTLKKSTTVKTRAFKDGENPSAIASVTFTKP